MSTMDSSFNFIEAVQRPETYGQLFPDEIEGMVIIALYEQLKADRYVDGYFGEEEIHSLFTTFQRRNSTDDKGYILKTRNREKIKHLLRFFLKYDEEKRLYSFQEYAYAFCDLSKETLKGALSTT